MGRPPMEDAALEPRRVVLLVLLLLLERERRRVGEGRGEFCCWIVDLQRFLNEL